MDFKIKFLNEIYIKQHKNFLFKKKYIYIFLIKLKLIIKLTIIFTFHFITKKRLYILLCFI